jgi:hypothetical protein
VSLIVSASATFAAAAMPAAGDGEPADPIVSDSTGAASFRIPIAVPPGPGGFAPNLALSYSSRAGDGSVGVGWSLRLPDVRCSDRFGSPDFASCQQYELGDTLLIADTQEAGRYHTVVESFQRIRHLTGGASGSWWTVEQPNGTKLYFGQSASHRIHQGGGTARWLLHHMVDASGNDIYFNHDLVTDPGEAYLESVYYGPQPAREIQLLYEPRPDPRLVFSAGVERHVTRRLREIQVVASGEIFRRYVFGYELAGEGYTTNRSRLSWVQEFGTDCTTDNDDPVEDCEGLPPRTFRYRDANDAGAGASQWSAPSDYDAYRIPFGDYSGKGMVVSKPGNAQWVGDINGDGLPDRLSVVGLVSFEPAPPAIQINTGSGFHGSSANSEWGQTAALYTQSLQSLEYDQPRLEFQQIPADAPFDNAQWWVEEWNDAYLNMYAMCSLEWTTRRARLSQELFPRGVAAETSSLAELRASGAAPSAGFVEPRPSVELVDLDADGLAELVVSTRLHGPRRHFDCNDPGNPLATPGPVFSETVTVVFRNTGSGWVNDLAAQELARGLPPF